MPSSQTSSEGHSVGVEMFNHSIVMPRHVATCLGRRDTVVKYPDANTWPTQPRHQSTPRRCNAGAGPVDRDDGTVVKQLCCSCGACKRGQWLARLVQGIFVRVNVCIFPHRGLVRSLFWPWTSSSHNVQPVCVCVCLWQRQWWRPTCPVPRYR